MKDCTAPKYASRVGTAALGAALAAAFAVALPRPAYADDVTPPPVPGNVQVEAGNEPFLVGHATGTQNYVCVPSGTGFAFVLFTPEATLFDDGGKQIITHDFTPNPFEQNTDPKVVAPGTIRATWQYRDTSTVWGQVKKGDASSDPAFVAPNAIAWLKVTVVGAQNGPTGGDKLSGTTFIQRLNTAGGLAPATGCSSPADAGTTAFVPYTADYFFYRRQAQ